MPIASLVLVLSPSPSSAAAAEAALVARPEVTLGERHGARLPVVLATDTLAAQDDLWFWINSLDGVTFATLAFVDYEDSIAVEAPRPSIPAGTPAEGA